MRYIALVLFFLFAFSCKESSKSELPIFNNISFKLIEGEDAVIIDSANESTYHAFFSNQRVQIPLFKQIVAEEYQIFIGIPFRTTIEQLNTLDITGHQSITHLLESNPVEYYHKSFYLDTIYLTEFALSCKGGQIFILATTPSKSIQDSLFNYQQLIERFNNCIQ